MWQHVAAHFCWDKVCPRIHFSKKWINVLNEWHRFLFWLDEILNWMKIKRINMNILLNWIKPNKKMDISFNWIRDHEKKKNIFLSWSIIQLKEMFIFKLLAYFHSIQNFIQSKIIKVIHSKNLIIFDLLDTPIREGNLTLLLARQQNLKKFPSTRVQKICKQLEVYF